jgi:hypothetical protein
MRNPPWGRNVMNAIMGLLAVSALAGLVLGFYFGLAALVVLWVDTFDFCSGDIAE